MRAGIDRKRILPYLDNDLKPIVGSYLSSLDADWSAEQRWLWLLSSAIRDMVPASDRPLLERAPFLVALPADAQRPDRGAQWLALELSRRLEAALAPRAVTIVAEGAYGGYRAIALARQILQRGEHRVCLVAAADSAIGARALLRLHQRGRLLAPGNPDGVIPGEAAACLLLTLDRDPGLATIRGVGFSREPATLDNDTPLRGVGIAAAAQEALGEAGLEMHDMHFRLSDASGESFAFKEQALVLSKLLRKRKETLPLWQSAGTLGDTGAAAGLCGLVAAMAAFHRGYAPGPRAIGFAGNEEGPRAALVIEAPAA